MADTFKSEFRSSYNSKMRSKLGLRTEQQEDEKLFEELFEAMYETGADFTNSFRRLSELKFTGQANSANDVAEFLPKIDKECSSADEYKAFFKPKLPRE